MRSRLGLTIRVRLTLVYGIMFVVGGIVLLALTYVLVRNSLSPQGGLFGGGAAVVGDATPVTDGNDIIDAAARSRLGEELARKENDFRAATVDSILRQGAIALGVVGVIAVVFGYLIAGRVLRPLHRITDTARRVSGGSLAFSGGGPVERIDLDGPRDEVKELADTFDEMLGRLARAFDSQSRFVANASHELRTPLAINRTLIEVALRRREAAEDTRRLGEALLVVNARHERLIEGLLTLARGETRIADATPVDLLDVATHVLSQTRKTAQDSQVEVRTDLHTAPTTGDPVLLERLVQNLVENALRYNHAGGWISVTTRGIPTGEATVEVANTGLVVPPYDVGTLFEPFRRLAADRVDSEAGAGLGLSIVRSVAGSHGGNVRAEPRAGGGLVVTVHLPPTADGRPTGPDTRADRQCRPTTVNGSDRRRR